MKWCIVVFAVSFAVYSQSSQSFKNETLEYEMKYDSIPVSDGYYIKRKIPQILGICQSKDKKVSAYLMTDVGAQYIIVVSNTGSISIVKHIEN